MTVQAGLCQTWSETNIAGFLMQRLILNHCNQQNTGTLDEVAAESEDDEHPLEMQLEADINEDNETKTEVSLIGMASKEKYLFSFNVKHRQCKSPPAKQICRKISKLIPK